jgi:hypothetical protein
VTERISYTCYRNSHGRCKNKTLKCSCSCHTSNVKDTPTKAQQIYYLLKTQPANIGMIRAFTNATPKSIRQYITLLRRNGATIYYNRTSGYYSLDKNKLLNKTK